MKSIMTFAGSNRLWKFQGERHRKQCLGDFERTSELREKLFRARKAFWDKVFFTDKNELANFDIIRSSFLVSVASHFIVVFFDFLGCFFCSIL